MRIVVPDYYEKFSCLMGDCKHSCCIGWEIDIDEEKLSYYQGVDGKIGARLKENISVHEDGACFRLDDSERCPFLNRDGLCDLILELGEDSLCQICADHPRFRNFFSDREEIGLGLCCEAAGQLILKHAEPVQQIIAADDGEAMSLDDEEQELLELRAEAISVVQDRSLEIAQRMERLAEWASLPYPLSFDMEWMEFFKNLECLDSHWHALLDQTQCSRKTAPAAVEWETAFEQLLVYLLMRHVPGALEDGDLAGRIAFVLLITDLLRRLCANAAAPTIDDLVEYARMYSSEIEYSDENIDAILTEIHNRYPEI